MHDNIWPDKKQREAWEIETFLRYWSLLPGSSHLKVAVKRDRPDYEVEDASDGKRYGVELTSVYISDRSVPEEHQSPSGGEVPDDVVKIIRYKKIILDRIKKKINGAQKDYAKYPELIIAIYINEYISMYITPEERDKWVRENDAVFDNIAPFTAIFLYPLHADDSYILIRPTP